MNIALPWLPDDPAAPFPSVQQALRRPNGLLAVGGDLSPVRLLNAYAHGVFPWFSEGEPILWWSPNPRMVLPSDGIRLSTRFRRRLRSSRWRLRADTAFDAVIAACAEAPRPGQDGTWISAQMRDAYSRLHALGHAHSLEVFDGERLVGGIYGVAIGRMFFGESMFSAESGGSKVALAGLGRWLQRQGMPLIDAQVENPHLLSMGGGTMPREAFIGEVRRLCALPGPQGPWRAAFDEMPASELANPA
ncbi:leucyl/phenylalanyl-tRNA--protein transferase [Luteimonas sp. e5]